MGFIDYRGTRKDRFSDVMQRIEEQKEAKRQEVLEQERQRFDALFRYCRMIFFGSPAEDREDEEFTMKDLYMAFQDNRIKKRNLVSTFPEEWKHVLMDDILPVFDAEGLTGLAAGEKICYMNQAILYHRSIGGEQKGDFAELDGQLYITNKRISFCGRGRLDLGHERIRKVVQYDAVPEILEIRVKDRMFHFQVPEAGCAYQALRLAARLGRGELVKTVEEVIRYENLNEPKDLSSCLIALESLMFAVIPTELRERINSVILNLYKIKKVTEVYPDKTDDIRKFLKIYIPEAVSMLLSYHRYQEAAIPQDMLQQVYEKVLDSVQTLDEAIEEKMKDMFWLETVNTEAQAETLKNILGQDGFV